ncbi:hypothetical protein D3C86_1645950 [compost metagenome]
MDAVGRASVVREPRRARPIDDRDTVALLGHTSDPQGDGRIDQIGDHIDLLSIEPLPGLGHPNVRLVQVVREDYLDGLAQHLAAKILHGHLNRCHRALASFVGKLARHVGQHANAYDVIRHLALRLRAAERQPAYRGKTPCQEI